VAAVAAAGAVAGVVVLVGAGSANADTDTLDLTYSCQFPVLAAPQTLDTKISVNLPTSIPVNTSTGNIAVTAVVTVPGTATQGLDLVGAASISGSASASATINAPGGLSLPLTIPLNIPSTPVPQDGSSFTTTATGSAPAIQFSTPGTGTVIVGSSYSVTLDPLTSSGGQTGLNTFTTTCNLTPAGQNTTLANFTVTGGTGGSSSSTTTTTSSTTSSTTTSSTTSSSSTTTTTSSPVHTTTTTTSSPVNTTTTTTGGGGGGTTPLSYNVAVTSHLQSLGSNIAFSGGLNVNLDLSTGNFSGPLTLGTGSTSFNLLGFIPGTAKVQLIPQGNTSGNYHGTSVTADTKETIRLTDVAIYGIPLVSNSTTCQTTSPSDIQLSSSNFSPLQGGTLTGTYTIAGLASNGCGFLTPFISIFTQSTGNTISAVITPAAS
jgi:hypothetical protein